MPFKKTGDAITTPQVVDLISQEEDSPQVGDKRDGKVWNGEEWVPEEDGEEE